MGENNSKQTIRKARDAAVSFKADLAEGDAIQYLWDTPDGLVVVARRRIIRVQSPDLLDPALEFEDAPWRQTILFEAGTQSNYVARTAVQTHSAIEQLLPKSDARRVALFNVGWRVMSSLLSLQRTLSHIDGHVESRKNLVAGSEGKYATGRLPKAVPPIEGLEDDFKAFAMETRQCLNHITDLFEPTMGEAVKPGQFHRARDLLKSQLGEDHPLHRMLEGDRRWIDVWVIGLTNTVKHHCPPTKQILVNDMRVLANRQIQLPTWQLFHPEFDLEKPQDLIETCKICMSNLLGLYENLFIGLIEFILPKLPEGLYWVFEDFPEDQRDGDCPMRYRLCIQQFE